MLLVVLAVLVPTLRELGLATVIASMSVGYALLALAQGLNPQETPRVDPE